MFAMSQEQVWNLAILIVVLLSVGGIIGGLFAWWRDMKDNNRR